MIYISLGSTSAGQGLEKQLLNKKLNETSIFFSTSEIHSFQLVCQNSEIDSAFLFRISAVPFNN